MQKQENERKLREHVIENLDQPLASINQEVGSNSEYLRANKNGVTVAHSRVVVPGVVTVERKSCTGDRDGIREAAQSNVGRLIEAG